MLIKPKHTNSVQRLLQVIVTPKLQILTWLVPNTRCRTPYQTEPTPKKTEISLVGTFR